MNFHSIALFFTLCASCVNAGNKISTELERLGSGSGQVFREFGEIEASGLVWIPSQNLLAGVSDTGSIFFIDPDDSDRWFYDSPINTGKNNLEGVTVDTGDDTNHLYVIHEGGNNERARLIKLSYEFKGGNKVRVDVLSEKSITSVPSFKNKNGIESIALFKPSTPSSLAQFWVGFQDTGNLYLIDSSGTNLGKKIDSSIIGDGVSGSEYLPDKCVLIVVHDNQDEMMAYDVANNKVLDTWPTRGTNEEGFAIVGNFMYLASDDQISFISKHNFNLNIPSVCEDSSTSTPTKSPTKSPTTRQSTSTPTKSPTKSPTTRQSTSTPTKSPTKSPTTRQSTSTPTKSPTKSPTTRQSTSSPTKYPSLRPSLRVATPTKSPTEPQGFQEVFYNTFENNSDFDDVENFASFRNTGSDVTRINNKQSFFRTQNGQNVLRIRDNSKTSGTSTGEINVNAYSRVRVEFEYYSQKMDNNEGFFLEFNPTNIFETPSSDEIASSDEASSSDETSSNDETASSNIWKEVNHFQRGSDYKNNEEWISASEEFSAAGISKMRIQFRCDGDNNKERIYIDNVKFSGKV